MNTETKYSESIRTQSEVPMTEVLELKDLYVGVADAATRVRITFASRTEIADVLDRFWRLQDHLALLVEAVADRPDLAAKAVREGHAVPVQSIVDILSFTSKLKIGKLPAISESCARINDSLWRLESLHGENRAIAARA